MGKVLDIPETEAIKEADNWQTAFALKADLRQKDIYAFEAELRMLEKATPTVMTVVQQALQVMQSLGFIADSSIEAEQHLKAAIKANWVENPLCEIAEISANGTGRNKQTRYFFAGENVDEMHPGKVRWYGRKVKEAFQKAVEIPDPN